MNSLEAKMISMSVSKLELYWYGSWETEEPGARRGFDFLDGFHDLEDVVLVTKVSSIITHFSFPR